MNIAFRVDSSYQISTGHVMRCLTLADELARRGHQVCFVCRDLPGNINSLIRDKGYPLEQLPATRPADARSVGADLPAHSDWLGVDQDVDAEQTAAAVERFGAPVDFLVVDHYALDRRWEHKLRARCKRLMVIDDLADRAHDCDLLLDQNLYENPGRRYVQLVPADCRTLVGPKFALLRPEFARARRNLRERDDRIGRVLVFLGGVDLRNVTFTALRALNRLWPDGISVDVVVGEANPNRAKLRRYCDQSPGISLHVQTTCMSELMSAADLAIGAGGAATWERCAVGLPSIVIALASNQIAIAEAASDRGAIRYLGELDEISTDQIESALKQLRTEPWRLARMSREGIRLADGQGLSKVAEALEETA